MANFPRQARIWLVVVVSHAVVVAARGAAEASVSRTIYYVGYSDPDNRDEGGKPRERYPFSYDSILDSPAAVEAFGTSRQVAEKMAGEMKKDHPAWKVWVSSREAGPELGSLSRKYEVGAEGSRTISRGKFRRNDRKTGKATWVKDAGGQSYGTFQLASERGLGGSTVQAFVNKYYGNDFLGLTPETPAFDAKWAEVVNRDEGSFRRNEDEFIRETHYEPVRDRLRDTLGLDLDVRSRALQNVVWSVAVQHGPPEDPNGHAIQLLGRALNRWDKAALAAVAADSGPLPNFPVDDKAIIDAVYAERARTDNAGKSVYFPKLDLSDRFTTERADALAQLAKERELRLIMILDGSGR